MAKKVYAITSGEYSDYSVDGICLNRVKAEKLAEQLKDSLYGYGARVEEFVLCDNAEILPTITLSFQIDESGNIVDESEHEGYKQIVVNPTYYWSYVWGNAGLDGRPVGRFHMSGTNIKRMRKVYSEKKAWLKASEVERRMNHSGRGRYG